MVCCRSVLPSAKVVIVTPEPPDRCTQTIMPGTAEFDGAGANAVSSDWLSSRTCSCDNPQHPSHGVHRPSTLALDARVGVAAFCAKAGAAAATSATTTIPAICFVVMTVALRTCN